MAKRVLHIPEEVLQQYGCRNCVWKGSPLCPQGFTKPEESLPEGYCEKLMNFLVSLGGDGDSLSQVKEKFFLHTQEIQALQDGTEFKSLQEKFRETQLYLTSPEFRALSKEQKDEYRTKHAQLSQAVEMSKLWWARLSEAVVKGHSRIADREKRSEDAQVSGGKITVQQLNVLLKESDKVLEDSTKKRELT